MMIELIECRFESERRAKITVKKIPSRLSRWFGAKEKIARYVGWCTTWHQLPGFKRADTAMEIVLCGFWAKSKWEQNV